MIIHSKSVASIEFSLCWQSAGILHTDCFFAGKVNFYRDIFPRKINDLLMGKSKGDKAISVIGDIYGQTMRNGMKVLDLMSSWRSHVPQNLKLHSLIGLGLNREEMLQNPQLTDHFVHDLNEDPVLPFADNEFDAVICAVSVEYLIYPFEVFSEIARILKTGGYFIVTFSNRWFPPKVVRIWTELNDFERMGIVLEYFLLTGLYKNLNTFSMRGLPRNEDDRYYPDIPYSDPVYAVWGQKR